jgi:predicted hydrocarbon binding protein
MGKKHGMLIALEKIIERFAGEEVMKKVMEKSAEITEKTDAEKKASWMKGAMERLDQLVDEETKFRIMGNCGFNCAEMNRGAIEEAVARRKKFKTVDQFLEAEQKKPMKGTRLVREGSLLYQYYTPQSFGVRCYCEMVAAAEGIVSPTYCHCSKGFVMKLWEAVLERPVDVEFVQSVISAAEECKFIIHLQNSKE